MFYLLLKYDEIFFIANEITEILFINIGVKIE